ncbi:hypothetical protein LCGC14_2770400, partial [marine sediment metagenome]
EQTDDGSGADVGTAEAAEVSYDVTFTYTITVKAVDIDAAVNEASKQWNSRQRFAAELLIDTGLTG